MSSLEDLYLHTNQLSSLPSELGKLSRLFWLYLHNNQLSGSIPAELGRLTSLTRLWLHRNQLSGDIPIELRSLTRLSSLGLDYNAATLCLSEDVPNDADAMRTWYNGSGPEETVGLCGTTAPGELAVTPVAGEPGRLRARWTAPTNPDFTLNGYHVEYSPDGGTTWTDRQTVAGESALLSGLPAGSYYVRVRAVGESPNNSIADTNRLGTL